MIRVR